MKTKTLILAITKAFFILLVMCYFYSCAQHPAKQQLKDYEIIVIDSCEYIYAYRGVDVGGLFTHKGNCRYCAERAKRSLK